MLKKEWLRPGCTATQESEVDLDDLKKIRKVQGFFRGWLCRHRWKVIVEEYIKSPHAESMRKRNRSPSFSKTFYVQFPPTFFLFLAHILGVIFHAITQLRRSRDFQTLNA